VAAALLNNTVNLMPVFVTPAEAGVQQGEDNRSQVHFSSENPGFRHAKGSSYGRFRRNDGATQECPEST
ncbi:MAG: hypothetical protein QG660_2338, partial [Pseudomonadota bacterium]|nr:hypothetical protein [Pseudomonadota bacterium]